MGGPKENTRLPLAGYNDYVSINVSEPKYYNPRDLIKADLEYSTAHPLWMKIRLCLFWSFWAAFILVLVISILMYLCLFPSHCRAN